MADAVAEREQAIAVNGPLQRLLVEQRKAQQRGQVAGVDQTIPVTLGKANIPPSEDVAQRGPVRQLQIGPWLGTVAEAQLVTLRGGEFERAFADTPEQCQQGSRMPGQRQSVDGGCHAVHRLVSSFVEDGFGCSATPFNHRRSACQ